MPVLVVLYYIAMLYLLFWHLQGFFNWQKEQPAGHKVLYRILNYLMLIPVPAFGYALLWGIGPQYPHFNLVFSIVFYAYAVLCHIWIDIKPSDLNKPASWHLRAGQVVGLITCIWLFIYLQEFMLFFFVPLFGTPVLAVIYNGLFFAKELHVNRERQNLRIPVVADAQIPGSIPAQQPSARYSNMPYFITGGIGLLFLLIIILLGPEAGDLIFMRL